MHRIHTHTHTHTVTALRGIPVFFAGTIKTPSIDNPPLASMHCTLPDRAVGLPPPLFVPLAPVVMWQPPSGKLLKYRHPVVSRHRCWHLAGVATVRCCPAMSSGRCQVPSVLQLLDPPTRNRASAVVAVSHPLHPLQLQV